MWLLQIVYFIKRELSTGSMDCLSEWGKILQAVAGYQGQHDGSSNHGWTVEDSQLREL